MKYSSRPPFEAIAFAYHSSLDPRESSDLMKGLANSLAVLTQSSSITGMNYVAQMKEAGLLGYLESPEDGRRRIPVLTARANQRYIDFLVESNISFDDVRALIKFQMNSWRSYRSKVSLTLVLFIFQLILSQPEGVGPDVITTELMNQTDLSLGTGKLLLRHLVNDSLIVSVRSQTNGLRRNYVLTSKGEELLTALSAARDEVVR